MIPFTRDLAPHSVALRFFDQACVVRSDDASFIALLAAMYGRFSMVAAAAAPATPLDFTLLTTAANPWGSPVLLHRDVAQPLTEPELLEAHAYDAVVSTVMAQVRSHLLIHAGALARDGRGLVIAGDAGHGKTTLTLALVARGYQFLSDEMAALGRADGMLHPFPRALRIRPGTLELIAGHGSDGFSRFGSALPTACELLDNIPVIARSSIVQPDSSGFALSARPFTAGVNDERRPDTEIFPKNPSAVTTTTGVGVGEGSEAWPAAAPREWMGKRLCDVEELWPGSLASAVPVKTVVILRDPATSESAPRPGAAPDLLVLLDRASDEMLAQVAGLSDVVSARWVPYGRPLLACRTARPVATLKAVEATAQRLGFWVLDASTHTEAPPSFVGPACLAPISRSQAALELSRRFLGGHRSVLLSEGRGAGDLFAGLAALLRGADCYRLDVGPLPSMIELVTKCVDAAGPRPETV